MILIIKDDNGESVGNLVANSKVFKTGSKGYFGVGKIVMNGKRYQLQFQAVEIGSKLQAPESEK